jgi:hypothetical protein
MGISDKAKDTLKDAAGGVRGARAEDGEARETRKPDEGKFEPEEVRRRKKPKDDLPQPEDFRPQG